MYSPLWVPPPLDAHAKMSGLPRARPLMGLTMAGLVEVAGVVKVPALEFGVDEVSLVCQYRNAATTSAGSAPLAVQGTTLANNPGPLVHGTPLKLIELDTEPLTAFPDRPTPPTT